MKRFLSIVLALSLALSLCATTALADGFGSTNQLSGSADSSGKGWSWDHTSRTLTLSGCREPAFSFEYDWASDRDFFFEDRAGSWVPGDMKIVLADGTSNTILGQIAFPEDNITICGNGSLSMPGEGYGNAIEEGRLIFCKALTVESGNLEIANGENKEVYVQDFTMTGGTVKLSYLNAEKTISVLGGKLTLSLASDQTPLSAGDLCLKNCEVDFLALPTFGSHITCDNLTLENCALGWPRDAECLEASLKGSFAASGLADSDYHYSEGHYTALDGTPRVVKTLQIQPSANHMAAGAPLIAYASTQSVLVDGTPIEFQMYALKDAAGNDTNYVKVRDVAQVLNGTAAQFSVSWDNGVKLTVGAAYTPNGSEMSTPFSGNRSYTHSKDLTEVTDGSESLLYGIESIILTDDAGGGYTYYKLRDLGNYLHFTVDWSAEKGVFVETGLSDEFYDASMPF